MREDFNTEPRQVLIVGNGFDLAQGFPTSYTDFIEFLRIPNLSKLIYQVKNKKDIDEKYKKYLGDAERIDLKELQRLEKLKTTNSWLNYFLNCNAEIKGWIDIEKEMIPVFDFFKWLFEQSCQIIGSGNEYYAQIQTYEENRYRFSSLFSKYIMREGSNQRTFVMRVLPMYSDGQYGVIKDKILETLKRDLDDFIEIFRIYLREIINQIDRKPNLVINNLRADVIISFNYIQSELFLSNLDKAQNFHVHGTTTQINNMVLGVNEVPTDQNNDFLYFTKSFQRIKIKSNPQYRDCWKGDFHATFFGHSLDITDEDIIKPLYINASHVKVFHHTGRDYENKIINLIKMVGIKQLENDIYNNRLEFLPC